MATSAEPDLDLSGLDPAFDGVLRRSEGRCEYFQDRNKRWPFHCDEGGYRLLARLLRAATPVVAAVQAKIEATCGSSSADVVAEGQRIYARKPNMGEHDVTWSQIEYAHLGLQKEYIRYKSVQRLTEAWACLQRARRAGVFDALDDTAPSPPRAFPFASRASGVAPGSSFSPCGGSSSVTTRGTTSTSSAWTSRSPGAPPRRGSGSAFRRGTCATAKASSAPRAGRSTTPWRPTS